ncbi:hypothetical protein Pmani_028618, partial [Petrolisthes manimaculis]
MVRVTLSRVVLLAALLVESLYLMVALQRLAKLEYECGEDYIDHDDNDDDNNNNGKDLKKETQTLPTLYILTATYKRNTQIADLTRLAQTLMHIPALHWIVVEDAQ